jgi:hypothetical protein
MKIIERGGIHRTKHEFGPFNRKHTPKHNKKRALIVQRGVYSEHSFAGLRVPSHYRNMKNLALHPFIARQKLKLLGRALANSVLAMSQGEGFSRRYFTAIAADKIQAGEAVVHTGDGIVSSFRGTAPHYGPSV